MKLLPSLLLAALMVSPLKSCDTSAHDGGQVFRNADAAAAEEGSVPIE